MAENPGFPAGVSKHWRSDGTKEKDLESLGAVDRGKADLWETSVRERPVPLLGTRLHALLGMRDGCPLWGWVRRGAPQSFLVERGGSAPLRMGLLLPDKQEAGWELSCTYFSVVFNSE